MQTTFTTRAMGVLISKIIDDYHTFMHQQRLNSEQRFRCAATLNVLTQTNRKLNLLEELHHFDLERTAQEIILAEASLIAMQISSSSSLATTTISQDL